MILEILFGLAIVLIVAMMFVIRNLLLQNDTYQTWVAAFGKRILNMHIRLLAIDQKGSFKSDDEVGFFFTELKGIFTELNDLGFFDNETVSAVELHEHSIEEGHIGKNYGQVE